MSRGVPSLSLDGKTWLWEAVLVAVWVETFPVLLVGTEVFGGTACYRKCCRKQSALVASIRCSELR